MTEPIEAMRDLAEQSANDGVDWIPSNFKRETVEESARAVLESYKEAQRKVTALGMRNSELEAALTAQLEAPEPDPYDGQELYEQGTYDDQPVPSHIDVRQAAAAAQQAVMEAVARPQAEAIVAEAERLVAASIPNYAQDRDQVMSALQANPAPIMDALATGNPTQIAVAIAQAHESLATDRVSPDLMRKMKLGAQSAVGTGGRSLGVTDEEARWQEISGANTGKLGL
jgi:hypothetical protein